MRNMELLIDLLELLDSVNFRQNCYFHSMPSMQPFRRVHNLCNGICLTLDCLSPCSTSFSPEEKLKTIKETFNAINKVSWNSHVKINGCLGILHVLIMLIQLIILCKIYYIVIWLWHRHVWNKLFQTCVIRWNIVSWSDKSAWMFLIWQRWETHWNNNYNIIQDYLLHDSVNFRIH